MKKESKPEVLYHGSQNGDIKKFEPRKANGIGRNEDQEEAIYATHDKKYAIAFALPIIKLNKNSEWSLEYTGNNGEPLIILKQCELDPNGVGYIYTLPSDSFTQGEENKMQWLSREKKGVEPKSKEIVYVKDYLHWVMTEEEYKKWLLERKKQRNNEQTKGKNDMPDEYHNTLLKLSGSCSNHYEELDKEIPEK